MDILQTYISAHPEQIGFWGIVIYMIFKDAVLPIGRFFGRLFTAQSEATKQVITAHQEEAKSNDQVTLRLIDVQDRLAKALEGIEKILAQDSPLIKEIHVRTGETHADVRALPKALDNRFRRIEQALLIINKNIHKTK